MAAVASAAAAAASSAVAASWSIKVRVRVGVRATGLGLGLVLELGLGLGLKGYRLRALGLCANLSRRRPPQKAPRGGLLGGDFLPVVSVLEVRG